MNKHVETWKEELLFYRKTPPAEAGLERGSYLLQPVWGWEKKSELYAEVL